MAEGIPPEKLQMLDACIEQLLAGRDWRRALPTDQSRAEILALMEVAEWLVESAGRTPRPPEHVRRRVWDRVARVIDRFSAAWAIAQRRVAPGASTEGAHRIPIVGGGSQRSTTRGGLVPSGAARSRWCAVPIAIVNQRHSRRG